MRLGLTNEPIAYTSRDEIGALIQAYNHMVDKLEESRGKLAQTEREVAWREMALKVIDKMLMLFPPRFSQAGKSALEKFIAGLSILKDPGGLFRIFLFNFVPWGLELFTYYFAGRAFGLDLTIREAALMMGMTNLAMIVPAGPGGIGLFESGGMLVVSLLGIEKGLGLAYILVVHALILLPINVWGAYFLWHEGISWQEALKGSRDEKKLKEKR